MKYLVMECHPGYAVVLDEQGLFLRAANLNYQVGQTVSHVELLHEVENPGKHSSRRLLRIVAAAACLCLVLLAGARLTLAPYGTVHIQINPEVEISVNRFDYVLDVNGVNPEGQALLQGYRPGMKKVDQVADELTDLAMSRGYLQAGGQIHLAVESSRKGWQASTQDRLVEELRAHTRGQVQVIGEDMEHWHDWEDIDPQPDIPEPTIPEEPDVTDHHGEDHNHRDEEDDFDGDDDWDDDDDQDDDDDDDDDQDDDDDDGEEDDDEEDEDDSGDDLEDEDLQKK